jgi:hypothetical protein
MLFRSQIGRSLKALLPQALLGIARSIYSPHYREAQREKRLHTRIDCAATLITEAAKQCIVSGPFARMPYISAAVGSALAPKLLGTYEKELNPLVESIIASQP